MKTIVAILVFACVTAAASAAENSSWLLEGREVPPPQAASSTLHDSIASTPQPDVVASSRSPQTAEAWEALIESTALQIPLALIEQSLNVAIETTTINDVVVYEVTPAQIKTEHADQLFLYAHGGAYVFNGGEASVGEAALVASMAGMKALAVDYRMPPDDPYPAAIDDMVTVYRELLRQYEPAAIAIGGTSAGAGLAMSTLHKLKELNLPLPGVLYAGTPWADLTKTSDSLYTNEGLDRILVTYDGYLKGAAELYADGTDLKNPLLSPLYGDFTGFPPTILVTGTRDLFLSDTVRSHRKLRALGIEADLHVYEGMSHAEYGFLRQAEESNDFYQELVSFISRHLQ